MGIHLKGIKCIPGHTINYFKKLISILGHSNKINCKVMWHGGCTQRQRNFVSPKPVIPGCTTQYSLPTMSFHTPPIVCCNSTPKVPLTP